MTYAQVSAAVISFLEIDATDASRFRIDSSLTEAQLEIANTLQPEMLRGMAESYINNLALGASEYFLPSDYLRVLQVRLDYGAEINNQNPGEIAYTYQVDQQTALNPGNDATKDHPFYDLVSDPALITIYPTPSAAQTNGLFIRYIKKPTDIASGTDPVLDDRFRNLLVYKATSTSALVENYRPDLFNVFTQKFDNEIRLIMGGQSK